ncbi:unnamed protein product [Urochloa humidicola]
MLITAQLTRNVFLSISRVAAQYAQLVKTSRVKLLVISVRNKHKIRSWNSFTTLVLSHSPWNRSVELMDSYATLLFAKITEIKPEQFCKQYGMCRDTTLFSGVRSESTCVFCHHLLDEIMSKLKDPDAEFEIIQILIKECNKIEGHVQQCKRLVLQYVPLILVNGEKFLEKNDVCALVQACPASQKTTVSSFLDEEGLVSDV